MPLTLDARPPSDEQLAEAIIRTLIYADVFNFPMRLNEIHHFLIGEATTPAAVEAVLQQSVWLAERIICDQGLYALQGRESRVSERLIREQASETLWPRARQYGGWLAAVPFVRMVALTGALAMKHAHTAQDDIDYLIVTAPGRVWLTRLMIILIVRMVRLRGQEICPNYVLAETALEQHTQDLYTAHEITQMIPLSGRSLYEQFRAANPWAALYLPNAKSPFYDEPEVHPPFFASFLMRIGEAVLRGRLGDFLEEWEQRRKLRKFARQAAKASSAAQLDPEHVKGHFNDYGYPALNKYQQRLIEYGLTDLTSEEKVR